MASRSASASRASSTRTTLTVTAVPSDELIPIADIECAQDVDELIRTTTSGRIAGIIAEPIQGVGGFITPPAEYFGIVAEIIRKYGGVLH